MLSDGTQRRILPQQPLFPLWESHSLVPLSHDWPLLYVATDLYFFLTVSEYPYVTALICYGTALLWRLRYNDFFYLHILFEASGGAVARGVTVNATGCGFDPHSRR